MKKGVILLVAGLSIAISLTRVGGAATAASSFDGSVELEHRIFLDGSAQGPSNRVQSSARLLMEYVTDWNNGDDQLVFEPFARLDSDDEERTHADIRQLAYSYYGNNSEFTVGLGRVFWGVTESQHLVDIVNQTDGVENIDGEDKLGQPMIRYSYFNDFGTFDSFLLPYFRERTFAGADSRLNGGFVVETDDAVYESSAQETNLDYALRYSNTLGAWGLGLSWFSGTSREPDLRRFADFTNGTTRPYYFQVDQFGADIQLTTGAWLFKFEGIQRQFNAPIYQDYRAATIGFEYTLVGLFGSVYDLGMLSEYSWDERDELATGPLQNDLFVGVRLAFNDFSDSQILFGISNDLNNSDSRFIFLEATTRIAPSLTLNVELRHFDSSDPADPLFFFKDNSFVQIGIEYFFD